MIFNVILVKLASATVLLRPNQIFSAGFLAILIPASGYTIDKLFIMLKAL